VARFQHIAILALMTVAAGTLVACSPTTSGTPTSESSASASETLSSQPPSSISGGSTVTSLPPLPDPPKNIDLSGVDPCSLITADQRRQLGIAYAVPGKKPVRDGGSSCSLDTGAIGGGWLLVVEPNLDPATWLLNKGNTDGQATTVAGYPAVKYHLSGIQTQCIIAIRTKRGQSLSSQYSGTDRAVPFEEYCAGATKVAEAALVTLLARG
jgi:hypothetical protein